MIAKLSPVGGGAFFLAGYGGMYLVLQSGATTENTAHLQYIVAACTLSCGLGSGWVYNSTIFTNSANFGLAVSAATFLRHSYSIPAVPYSAHSTRSASCGGFRCNQLVLVPLFEIA
eukprot:SAG11_NODE_872_length_6802_cov_8.951514_13_plen_116_part_00